MSASRTYKSDKTSSAPSRLVFDGRLSLEQQRNRAKELLRALHASDPDAIERFAQNGQTIPDTEISETKLADAQMVIARENGFASWPKLKHHIDRITEHTRQIATGTQRMPDTGNTLHLRCGSDIRNGLQIAGFLGDFLEFADPFCQGPVPNLPLDEFVSVRADFIASSYQITPKDALARCLREYGALTTLGDYEHVVLWFEHDSYDQLILAFLMDFIAASRPNTRLELISVGQVPGVERFIGLGQLSPELLIWCWENHRLPVSEAMLRAGQSAWQAVRSSSPDALQSVIEKGDTSLPHMIAALKRHHAERPDPQTGLGLTQKLILQIITDHGPLPVGKVFGHLMRSYDPLPYLGDLMFWTEIQTMMKSTTPLFTLSGDNNQDWPTRTISLTPEGTETLSGKRNFLKTFTGTRWVGGIEIAGNGISKN